MEPRTPGSLDDFLFDLRGYLVLESALEKELLSDLNSAFDNFPQLQRGEWWGNVQRRDYTDETGFELHNCVEAGEPFERLIDHPSWIQHLRQAFDPGQESGMAVRVVPGRTNHYEPERTFGDFADLNVVPMRHIPVRRSLASVCCAK